MLGDRFQDSGCSNQALEPKYKFNPNCGIVAPERNVLCSTGCGGCSRIAGQCSPEQTRWSSDSIRTKIDDRPAGSIFPAPLMYCHCNQQHVHRAIVSVCNCRTLLAGSGCRSSGNVSRIPTRAGQTAPRIAGPVIVVHAIQVVATNASSGRRTAGSPRRMNRSTIRCLCVNRYGFCRRPVVLQGRSPSVPASVCTGHKGGYTCMSCRTQAHQGDQCTC